jgi:hypothetical protein
MLAFLAQLPAEIPAHSDSVVSNWILGALGAFALYEKLTKLFGKAAPEERKISGTVDTKPASTPAEKSDVEDELEKVDGELEKITASIALLSTKLDDKVFDLNKAGEARAHNLTVHINAELAAIRQDNQNRLQLVHDKIAAAVAKDAAHDEAISTLKVTQNVHGNQIAQIHQRIPKSRLP